VTCILHVTDEKKDFDFFGAPREGGVLVGLASI